MQFESNRKGPSRWLRCGVALLAAGSLVACTTASDETGEMNDTTSDSMATDVVEAVEDLGERAADASGETWDSIDAELSALEEQLESLRDEIGDAGRTARSEWDDRVAVLEEQANKLRADLEELSDESSEAWDEFAARARDTMSDVRDRIAEITENFESPLG